MAAANSSGGVMGKMISLQSIAVASAATAMRPEDEPKLFRFTLRHSIFLLGYWIYHALLCVRCCPTGRVSLLNWNSLHLYSL